MSNRSGQQIVERFNLKTEETRIEEFRTPTTDERYCGIFYYNLITFYNACIYYQQPSPNIVIAHSRILLHCNTGSWIPFYLSYFFLNIG